MSFCTGNENLPSTFSNICFPTSRFRLPISRPRRLTSRVRVETSNVRKPIREAKLARAELNSATATRNSASTEPHSSSPLRTVPTILPVGVRTGNTLKHTNYSKSTGVTADMNCEIFQRSGKDICSSIGKLLRLIVGIRKMIDDVQLSKLATDILHVLVDQVLATYFTIRNLRRSE